LNSRPSQSAPSSIIQTGEVTEDHAWAPTKLAAPGSSALSARQFRFQLLAADLLDEVEAWIAAQDRATQIACESSSVFNRDNPMMNAGFEALEFTTEQVDAFFEAAAKL
jgi:hypothetical protein